jgi:MOSC domain-containing protein YiiM
VTNSPATRDGTTPALQIQLIGQPFTLDFGDHQVEFLGARHCAPCAWMDAMLAPGARKFLRGRGGLRARIVTSGTVKRGKAVLATNAVLDPLTILDPRSGHRLP